MTVSPTSDSLKTLLSQIGFSKTQIELYFALLKLGPANKSRLAAATGLPRTTIYENLTRLKKNDLVTYQTMGNTILVAANSPERFTKILTDEISDLHKKIEYNLKVIETLRLFMKELTMVFNRANEKYFVESYVATACFSYGNTGLTTMNYARRIVSTVQALKEIYYINTNPTALLRFTSGTKIASKRYKRVRDFPTWSGDSLSGPSAEFIHRVSIPIGPLAMGDKLEVRAETKSIGTYKEVVKDIDPTFHGFYFRMIGTTLNASLNFILPKGKVSYISQLSFQVFRKNDTLFVGNCDDISQATFLCGEFGKAHLGSSGKQFKVCWEIPRTLDDGTICKLVWYTKKL